MVYQAVERRKSRMSDKIDKHKVEELKEMIEQKGSSPVEKVLAVFCERHAISMRACHVLYNRLVEKGEIKEE